MDADKFWARVDRRGTDDCWEWRGARHPHGYGQLTSNYRSLKAHRVAYELGVGPIPGGQGVLHRCDNPPCCNPAHLFTGTHAENMADMNAKGRHRGGSVVGHSFAPKGSASVQAKLTEPQVVEIRQRYAVGDVTQVQLAKEYGVCGNTVSRIVRGLGWKCAGPGVGDNFRNRAGRNGGKLTQRKADTIRALLQSGQFTRRELAGIYQIDISQVSRIVQGLAWICPDG